MTDYQNPPVEWLLDVGDAWVQYRTRRDLLGQPETAPEVQAARAAMLDDPRIQSLIDTLQSWPGPPLTSHKQAGQHLHLLSFLAEIGLRASDPGVGDIVERVIARQADEGAFQIAIKVSKAYGGSDQPMLAWALCDAPLVLWALRRMDTQADARLARSAEHLVSLIRDNGWPCATAPTQSFRGPGRKDDPCPYATLLCLKALAAFDGDSFARAANIGIETLLWHWDIQHERKLYLFGIGTDFRKPKFPLVWYDILHVIDVLSHYPLARRDSRYRAMLGELMQQANDAGQFTAAALYRPWKEWEFADKKNPSPAITLIAWRAAQR